MDQGPPPRQERETGEPPRTQPRRLGRYRVIGETGRGSNGVVYEALDEHLDRRVALKVLPANISLDEKTIKRFYREAEAAARLSHPGIVPIYEINEVDGTHYYAMEFVDGVSLDVYARKRDVSPREAARLIRDAAHALHAAHEKGVVHRDVKPSNLLVRANGDILVSDFGLARHDKSATLTSTDAIVGTPRYMSPEQILARQSRVDGRSDVYSLGVTLYELLTGRAPFDAVTIQAFLKQVLEEPPTPPRKRNRSIARDLETIVLKAIARDAADRYQTAKAFAEDLDRYLHSEPIVARRPGLLTQGREYASRHRVQVLSVALILATAVVLGLLALNRSGSKTREYDQHLRQAIAAREAGDYEGATVSLAAAIGVDGRRPEAYVERSRVLLIQCARADGGYERTLVDQATADLSRARDRGATEEETLELATELAFLGQDWARAADLATRVLEGALDPSRRARFLYIRGGSRAAMGDHEATKDLQAALKLDPANKDVRDLLATTSDMIGKPALTDRVREIGAALVKVGSEGSSTYGAMTNLIAKAAPESFRQISGSVLLDLVINALPGGESQASEDVEAFDRLLAVNPSDPDALIGRGRSFMRLGEYSNAAPEREQFFRAALSDFRTAYEAKSDAWEAYYWAALIGVTASSESGLWNADLALTEARYADLTAADDRRPEVRDVLAEVSFRAGNKAEALQIVDELIETDPRRQEYYRRRRAYFTERS